MQQTAKALRAAENAADCAQRLPAARERATTAHDQATSTGQHAEALTAQAGLIAISETDRTDSEQAYARVREQARLATKAAAEAEGDYRVAGKTVEAAERTRDIEEQKLRVRRETADDLERKTAVKEALDVFRKDRIARLAPELSEVATDFVSRMTNGKYVAVELDEEFTPILTDRTGRQRPVSWLSGGEESAVALALRVAIGELIAGQTGGVLFLDEVLTAQDNIRRPAMMAAIRDLPGRQIITINHVTEASDMVDLVLDVLPDEDHGSVIVEAAAAMDGSLDSIHDIDEELLANIA